MIIFLFLIPFFSVAQQLSVVKYGVFDPLIIIKIESAVQEKGMTRKEADDRYNFYLNKGINLLTKKDNVMESHYRKVGVEDLDQLRNNMLKRKFPVEKIEASLGGMLRVISSAKAQKEEYQVRPLMESYFKDRLGLNNSQFNYIINLSKRIAQVR